MKEPPGLPELETLLRHRFTRPELLTRALTHRSLAYEQRLAGSEGPAGGAEAASGVGSDPDSDNEQLEFLGDAVVGFLVAEDLCKRYPELHEGELTRLRAELVSRRHLGLVAATAESWRAHAAGTRRRAQRRAQERTRCWQIASKR